MQGWICDFNQNGKNEIYYLAQFNIAGRDLLIIEFDGKAFVTDYVYTGHNSDIESVDWNKKIIVFEDGGNFVKTKKFKGWTYCYYTVVWDEKLKEYILLKREDKYEKYDGDDDENFETGA